MDNERQPRRPCRRYMTTKADFLGIARTVIVVIIEPGLADRDHLGMSRLLDQLLDCHIKLLMRMVRMRSDRTVDVRKSLGDRQQLVEPAHPRGDRHDTADIRRRRPLPSRFAVALDIRE